MQDWGNFVKFYFFKQIRLALWGVNGVKSLVADTPFLLFPEKEDAVECLTPAL